MYWAFVFYLLDDKLPQMHLWPARSKDFTQVYVSNNTIIILPLWTSHHSFQNASAFCIAVLSCGTNVETEVTKLETKLMSSHSWALSSLVHSI